MFWYYLYFVESIQEQGTPEIGRSNVSHYTEGIKGALWPVIDNIEDVVCNLCRRCLIMRPRKICFVRNLLYKGLQELWMKLKLKMCRSFRNSLLTLYTIYYIQCMNIYNIVRLKAKRLIRIRNAHFWYQLRS